MAGTDVIIRYLADTSRLRSEVAKVEGTGSKMKMWAGGVAASIGAAFAVQTVMDFANAASAVTESMSKVEQVFGTSAQSVKDWAKTTTESIHVSEGDALKAVGTFGNLAVALGLPTDQAAAMSQSMVTLAADLGSFNDVPTEEALAALQSGLVGEVEPLRKFGVSLSAARIEAEALTSGLAKAPVDMAKVTTATEKLDLATADAAETTAKYGEGSEEARKANLKVEASQRALDKAMKGGKVELDAATKAQATYALIMKDTEAAQGDVARTGDTLAGKQKELTAKWEDAQVQIGTFLLPAMTALFDVGAKLVDGIFQLDDAFASMVGFVQDNVTWLTPLAVAILALSAPTIAAAVAAGALAIAHTAQAAAAGVASVAMGIFNAVMSANPIILVIAAIAALTAGFILAYQKVDWFRGAIDTAWQALQTAFDWIQSNWPTLLAILTGPIGLATLAIVKNWDTIKSAAATLYNTVRGWLEKVVSFFSGVKDRVGQYARNISDFFASIGRAAQDTYNKVTQWIGKIAGYISGVVGSVSRAAGNVADAIKRPINAAIRALNSFHVPEFEVGKISVAGREVFGGMTLGGWRPFNIPELAKGGIVTGPTLAMIGEKGPEAVIPLNRFGANGRRLDQIVDAIVTATRIASTAAVAVSRDATAVTVATSKAALATITRVEKAVPAAIAPAVMAVSGHAKNLHESLREIGRNVSLKDAQRMYEQAGKNFLNLPKHILDAFRRAGTFFEDFSFKPNAGPPKRDKSAGFIRNLQESLGEIGRNVSLKEAARLYQQAGKNFMNLPKHIIDAFRRAGTFFEDYSFRKFASGGIVTRPTLGMVGEAGPEAVIPLSRLGGLGNSFYTITVNVPPTADAATVGRATVDAIAAYERRNGASWRAS